MVKRLDDPSYAAAALVVIGIVGGIGVISLAAYLIETWLARRAARNRVVDDVHSEFTG